MVTTRTHSHRTLLAGSVTAAALLLTACGGSGDTGGEDSGEQSVLATVEHRFGTTEVLEPEDGELSVVALGWSDAEAALALGVKPVMVQDWMGFGEESKGVGPWAADLFGDAETEVLERSDGDLDYERIQALDPDVILNVNSDYDEAAYERLSEIAPTISGPEDAVNFNPGWDNQTRLIGEALGKAEEGEALVQDVEDRIDETHDAHPEFSGLQAVTGSKFGDAYGLSYTGDLRWDFLEYMGFEMYSEAAALEPDEGFFANVSQEQVEVFDADVAVLFPIGYTLAELEDDELISSLDVVQDGRAVLLDPEDDLTSAFSVGSALSLDVVIDELPPLLAEAADKVE